MNYSPSTDIQRDVTQEYRNIIRLCDFRKRKEDYVNERLKNVSKIILDRMKGYDLIEIQMAILRARRVIDGGGTDGNAIYHALGHEPNGPEAA